MSDFSITTNDQVFKEVSSFLNKGVLEPAKKIVNRVAGYAENRMGLNASKDVYSYEPKKPTYKRTGRLLGGRGSSLSGGMPVRTNLDSLEIKLEANPKLKGASFNYAPYVNAGTGWMKGVGKRPFFDNTVKETQEKAPNLAREELDAYISKSIFK